MDSSPDSFDSLQKLLRLKRYEQPPPRYFNEFSATVISRIRAGESRRARAWWERFGFDLRPLITLGAGSLACGMLLATVGFSVDNDTAQLAGTPSAALLTVSSSPAEAVTPAVAADTFAVADTSREVSTEPVMSRSAPRGMWHRLVQPVSFSH